MKPTISIEERHWKIRMKYVDLVHNESERFHRALVVVGGIITIAVIVCAG